MAGDTQSSVDVCSQAGQVDHGQVGFYQQLLSTCIELLTLPPPAATRFSYPSPSGTVTTIAASTSTAPTVTVGATGVGGAPGFSSAGAAEGMSPVVRGVADPRAGVAAMHSPHVQTQTQTRPENHIHLLVEVLHSAGCAATQVDEAQADAGAIAAGQLLELGFGRISNAIGLLLVALPVFYFVFFGNPFSPCRFHRDY